VARKGMHIEQSEESAFMNVYISKYRHQKVKFFEINTLKHVAKLSTLSGVCP
jgi:hypothetical protein